MSNGPETGAGGSRTRWLDRRAVGRLLVGAVLGALTLWLTFRGVDLSVVAKTLIRMRLAPVSASVALIAATVVVAGRRWELLVHPLGESRRLPRFIAAVVTGQMLNILLPMRLGEFARAYWISRVDGQPLGRVLMTVAVERLADVLMLGGSITILLLGMSLPVWAKSTGQLALGVSVAAAVCAAALVKWGAAVLGTIEQRLAAAPGWMSLLVRHARAALHELRAFADWRTSAQVWILSALLVALGCVTNLVLFRAFDLTLSAGTALLLFVVLQIGGAPAATPGNLGIFHYLVVLVLTAYGVERTVAVAYAIVLHAIVNGPKILAGALIVATTRTPVLQSAVWNESIAAEYVGR